ncbi:MAG TPA: glycogen debranching N-terminal domain-containing protein, partial [Actinomycetota bacterium]|nr:glycogen debranching N-terminal domain-containing protein [Actinomycetota bacterium]
MGKAPVVTDIRDNQVIKHNRTFFLSNRFGDVPEDNQAALGLYFRDTRFLSRLELTLDDLQPLLLHSSTERNYWQIVELAYPIAVMDPQGFEQKENVGISRSRLLADSLLERIEVANYGSDQREIRLRLQFDADFLDVFEVRGLERRTSEPGQHQKTDVTGDSVTFNYAGSDGVARSTEIRFSPAPEKLTEHEAVFEFTLDHGEEADLTLEITPIVEGERRARQEYREARQGLEQSYASWRKRCTRFKTGNTQLTGFLERAVIDLRMLLAEDDDGGFRIDAGVPWYSALFGRDAIITAYECLGVNPNIAWGALRALASQQGKGDDDWREEEPGKILHEVRVGELAGCGEIPHTPYFGSVDTTPLWLVLLTYAYAWTADLDAVRELWPNALAALEWIDTYGDRDGDGFVE